MLVTRWIGLEPINGQSLMLSTASLSALGYEHTLEHPAIQLWNDTRHLLLSSGKESVMTTSEVTR